jgi:thiol:disulfide interchange protein DsbD
MGAAIGYAFMQNTMQIFAVFTALALGYAVPYALIELYPQVVRKILPRPGKWMQKIKYLLSVPILLTSVWLFWVLGAQLHTGFRQNSASSALLWQNYDTEEVSTLAESGEKVFIDFTADWCLTCQFNEKLLLQSAKFENWVKQNNVHLFRADLTEDNDTYDAALSAYGRDGIPVYIYYTDGTYRILPIFFSVDKL